MLTEEALILLATLGASGLLVLGVAELAWPAKPRTHARRPRPTPGWTPRQDPPAVEESPAPASTERASAPAMTASAAATLPEVAEPEVAEPSEPIQREPVPREPVLRELAHEVVPDEPPAIEPLPPAPEIELPPSSRALLAEPEAPRPQLLPIDTCLEMYNEGRYAEVVSLGSAALQVHARLASVSGRSHEAAPLLDLVGLSKRELGDRDGAREMLRDAVLDADASTRPSCIEHLVALVEDAIASGGAPDAPGAETARARELRACLAALDQALGVASADEALACAQVAVRDALATAAERLVARVVSGDADDTARALVVEVLADETMPAPWRERLREQLAAASSAEIGQLTAQAIRSVQDGKDGEALEALERAERLAAALPIGAVADERREEFERRLWWGYTKVGLRRVEVKNCEGALEPLFRAIRLGGIDEERLTETRTALIRAVEGVVETRWPAIQQLVVEDATAAHAELEKLSAILRSATQRGLSPDDLGDAFARVTRLEQTLSHSA